MTHISNFIMLDFYANTIRDQSSMKGCPPKNSKAQVQMTTPVLWVMYKYGLSCGAEGGSGNH